MVSKLWFIDSSELSVPFQVVVRSKLFSKEYQAVFHIYLFYCVNTCTCWCKKTDSKIIGALPGSKAIALNHTSSDHILKHNSHMKISCILILILNYCHHHLTQLSPSFWIKKTSIWFKDKYVCFSFNSLVTSQSSFNVSTILPYL